MSFNTHFPLKPAILAAVFLSAHLMGAEVTRVACVGDSITFGAGVHQPYPARLGRWLGTNYDVRNFGVSATTLLHHGDYPYISRPAYTNALAFKPDIVIINFGANDSKHPGDGSLDATNAVNNWQYKGDFIGDYKEMIAAFRQTNPTAKVFVCYPTPDFPGRWGINDKTIHEEMMPMIHTVADETGASVINLRAPLAGKKDLFPDTVHPNDSGARLMAATIYQALTGNLPPREEARQVKQFNLFPPYYAWDNNFDGAKIGWQPRPEDAAQWTASFDFATNSLYGYPASIRGWHYGWNPAGDDLFPKKLSAIGSLPCSFSYNCGGDDLHGDFAYDMFFRPDDQKAEPQLEVMVGVATTRCRLEKSFPPTLRVWRVSVTISGREQTRQPGTLYILSRRMKEPTGCRPKANWKWTWRIFSGSFQAGNISAATCTSTSSKADLKSCVVAVG